MTTFIKAISTVFCIIFVLSCSSRTLSAQTTNADKVLKKGAWELQLFYRAPGSRSEGVNGVLYYQGKRVPNGTKNEIKETDLGQMKYWGEYGSGVALYAVTGWCFKDVSLIPRSTDGTK